MNPTMPQYPEAEKRTLSGEPSSPPDMDNVTLPPAEALSAPLTAVAQAAKSVSVPGYQVLGVLGRGGMGVVYDARHLKLNRRVALKMILSGSHAGDAELARFHTEAQAIARLQHPNIVQVYEVGEHQGSPFLSLEFCGGASLAQKLATAPLSPEDAATLVETLARAMHAAHEHNVIHRDLKPANVLLTEHAVPKITDFGLARKLDEAGQTHTGQVMGTPSYMAPEQAEGKSAEMGPPADIYALGAILYECLTGRPPFKASTSLETILQVVSTEPVPPTQLQPKTPRDLETICLKCLQKSPARRYAAARDLADDLGRFSRGEPVLARPVGKLARVWRWCRRKPALAATTAAAALGVVLAFITFAVAFFVVDDQLRKAEKLAREKDDLARKEHETAQANGLLAIQKEALAKKAEDRRIDAENGRRDIALKKLSGEFDHLFFRSTENPAVAMVGSAKLLSEARKLEDKALEDSILLHLGAWAADSLRLHTVFSHLDTSDPESRRFAGSGSMVAVLSPDGNILLTGGQDGTARLWNARTGNQVGPTMKHDFPVHCVAFSPDGKRVLTGCGQMPFPYGSPEQAKSKGDARFWDVSTGKQLGPTLAHEGAVVAAAFNLEGTIAVTGSWDNKARLWDTATGKQLGPDLQHDDPPSFPGERSIPGRVLAIFSPEGKLVLTGGMDNTARLWETETGKQIGDPLKHKFPVNALAFSPDGKMVLTGSGASNSRGIGGTFTGQGEARLWDVATRNQVGPSLHDQNIVTCVAFNPFGNAVATGSADGTARFWEASTGRALGFPLQHQMPVTALTYSPDSNMLLTGSMDGTTRLWDCSTSRSIGPPLQTGWVSSLAFSPDGNFVLSANEDHMVRLWDLARGIRLAATLEHARKVEAIAFSADGRMVATAGESPQGEGEARLWDASTGQQIGPGLLHPDTRDGNGVWIHALAFSPDGKTLLTGSHDKTARLWDTSTGKQLLSLEHKGPVWTVAFSSDGKQLLTADHWARFWDASSGKPIGSPMKHGNTIHSMALSKDGKTLVTGSIDMTARIWNVPAATPIGEPLHREAVYAVALSPDARIAATGCDDGTACLWDTATGKQLGPTLKHQGVVRVVRFSPNGKVLLTAGADQTARLWDTASGKQLTQPLQHNSGVFAAAFSPDGKTILTGSDDKTAHLWETTTGHPLGSPLQHSDKVSAVTFSPDGTLLLTASDDGTARIWIPPVPVHGDPQQIVRWAQVSTGLDWEDGGLPRSLDAATWLNQSRELVKLGGPPIAIADDRPQKIHDVIWSHLDLGDRLLDAGAVVQAYRQFQLARSAAQQRTDSDASNREARRDLACSLSRLGFADQKLERFTAANAYHKQSLDIARQLARENDSDFLAKSDVMVFCQNFGNFSVSLGEHELAKEIYEERLGVASKLADLNQDDKLTQQNLFFAYESLGDVSLKLHRLDEAKKHYQDRLRVARKLAEDPADTDARKNLLFSYLGLIDVCVKLGQLKEAKDYGRERESLCQKQARAQPKDIDLQAELAVSYLKLGGIEEALPDHAAARKWFEKACKVLEPWDKSGQLKDTNYATDLGQYKDRVIWCRLVEDCLSDLNVALNQPAEKKRNLLLARTKELARKKDLREADAGIEQLAIVKDPLGEALFAAARAHAYVAGVSDSGADDHKAQALKLLRAAGERGCFDLPANRELLASSRDLEAVRGKPEFARLIEQLDRDTGRVVFEKKGRLHLSDPVDRSLEKSPHQVYEVDLTTGKRYVIALSRAVESAGLDPVLRLENEDGKELARDNNSGVDRNALLVFIPEKSARFRIVVTSSDGSVGSYQLSVRERE